MRNPPDVLAPAATDAGLRRVGQACAGGGGGDEGGREQELQQTVG